MREKKDFDKRTHSELSVIITYIYLYMYNGLKPNK